MPHFLDILLPTKSMKIAPSILTPTSSFVVISAIYSTSIWLIILLQPSTI